LENNYERLFENSKLEFDKKREEHKLEIQRLQEIIIKNDQINSQSSKNITEKHDQNSQKIDTIHSQNALYLEKKLLPKISFKFDRII